VKQLGYTFHKSIGIAVSIGISTDIGHKSTLLGMTGHLHQNGSGDFPKKLVAKDRLKSCEEMTAYLGKMPISFRWVVGLNLKPCTC